MNTKAYLPTSLLLRSLLIFYTALLQDRMKILKSSNAFFLFVYTYSKTRLPVNSSTRVFRGIAVAIIARGFQYLLNAFGDNMPGSDLVLRDFCRSVFIQPYKLNHNKKDQQNNQYYSYNLLY